MKPLKPPAPLRQLDVLMQRLPAVHPAYPKLEASYYKRRAGYRGEQSLTFIFNRFFQSFHILQDLRLPAPTGGHFQIDAMIVAPPRLFLLEAKNFKGTIQIDSPHGLLTRRIDGATEQFPNPLLQLESTSEQLQTWAKRMGLPQLDVHHLAVFTHPDHVLQRPEGALLLRPDEISWAIKRIMKGDTPTGRARHDASRLWCKALIDAHTPMPPPPLEQWGLAREQVPGGVWCAGCKMLTARWVNRRWRCEKCDQIAAKGHVTALEDFFALSSEPFTNAEIQSFLFLPQAKAVTRFLQEAGCVRLEKPRSHLYISPAADA
ncbi:nuclease-related domain-containing protein [Salsuginibacillus halophilus]|uniref:nuclease-related domain-containing protein n=1 Tax=Salsuginibacillus halophilus TaxID=517424 RepID=UPI000D0CA018|nr:nuclease-related domain-containing protein [Salsuginibacillus halophilus]